MIVVSVFVVALIMLPLIWQLWIFRHPLEANREATAFDGRFHGWSLTHVTGRALGSKTVTETHGSGSVQGSTYSGFVHGSSRVRTDVHDSIRLQLADGSQTNVELENYNAHVADGDVVSVWNASKGNKELTIAFLNHTTNQQKVGRSEVFKIIQPHFSLVITYILLSILPVALVTSGTSAVGFIFWIVLCGLYVRGQKRNIDSFCESGIASVWQKSTVEAQPLLAK